jgi:ABC-type multidrug transport system ATPase subunit
VLLQAVVQQALSRLMAGRTVLVIAHRLSTIRDANRICVISNGQLAEQGSHEELISTKGLYAGLIARQIDNSGSNGSSDVDGGQALSIGSFGSRAAGGSMSDLSDGARPSFQGTSGRGSMSSSRSSTGRERSSIEAAAAEAVAAAARSDTESPAGDGKSQQ